MVKMYDTCSDSWSNTYVATRRVELVKQIRFGGFFENERFLCVDSLLRSKFSVGSTGKYFGRVRPGTDLWRDFCYASWKDDIGRELP